MFWAYLGAAGWDPAEVLDEPEEFDPNIAYSSVARFLDVVWTRCLVRY
jgi:hypothetical protein